MGTKIADPAHICKQFRVGVVGAGIIAESHLKPASAMQNVKLAAIADIAGEKAWALAEKYSMKAYTDYEAMLDNEALDLVVINLPHFLHRPAALKCAEKGCHILLEKPMALDEQECEDIILGCEKHGVKLTIGHIQCFNPANVKAREIVESGEMGRLLAVNNVRYTDYFIPSRPRWFLNYRTAGGGIVMNLGAHSFDIMQYLTGSRVKSVRATTGSHTDGIEVEGNALVFAAMENGVAATISLSGYKAVYEHETELIFTKGMLKINFSGDRPVLSKSTDGKYVEIPIDTVDPFGQHMSGFIECVAGNSGTPVTGEYGKSVIKAIKAVYRSSETGTEVEV